jgi:hypothetical protein
MRPSELSPWTFWVGTRAIPHNLTCSRSVEKVTMCARATKLRRTVPNGGQHDRGGSLWRRVDSGPLRTAADRDLMAD